MPRPRLGRKEPNMLIIGCDYHPSFQQIAWVDTESGECGEQRLGHSGGEAETYYCGLNGQRAVGIEATGYAHWFEGSLAELNYELWVGDGRSLSPGVGAECRESG